MKIWFCLVLVFCFSCTHSPPDFAGVLYTPEKKKLNFGITMNFEERLFTGEFNQLPEDTTLGENNNGNFYRWGGTMEMMNQELSFVSENYFWGLRSGFSCYTMPEVSCHITRGQLNQFRI